MPRFFAPSDAFSDGKISIVGDDAHHIARSLRMAEGDTVTVCDMHGCEHCCRLIKIRDEECIAEILNSKQADTEPPCLIALFMAYPKGDKLEVVTQKAVELGASRIIPFESSRCIKRPKADKNEKNTRRLQRIAEEAAKQCGRGRLPEVSEPTDFAGMLDLAKEYDLTLFCYEGDGTRTIKEILKSEKKKDSIAVIVGSEGGFSLDEANLAADMGFNMTGLGRRILRCETAPSFALSSLVYELEL